MDIKNEIELEFTLNNLKKVLNWGASPEESQHGHQAIAYWCERFWNKYLDTDASQEIEKLMPLLAEIECEWDFYMASYTEQHPHEVKTSPRLPLSQFQLWLKQIDA